MQVSTESLECRDLRHSWKHYDDRLLERSKKKWSLVRIERTLECERCGTQRIDQYIVSKLHVEKVNSKYRYPEGYIVKGGEMNVEKARVMLFSHFLEDSEKSG